MAKIKNANQIFRQDGKNCFLEVLNTAFGIDKVLINFIEYDPNQGNKQTKKIQIYMDVTDFLVFAQDVKSGRIPAIQKQHENDQYPYTVKQYEILGGTSAKSLEKQNKKRPDGKSVSRQFKLVVGKKYILQAEMGPGHENETGLIVPDYNTKTAEQVVKVPMELRDLKALVLLTEMHLGAYISKGYMNDEYSYKPEK